MRSNNKQQQMNKRETWVRDVSNAQYERVRVAFGAAMQEQAHGPRISYYDFLLVAKKMNFRFEQSSHLMTLKNFFAKHKNMVLAHHLLDVLCLASDSLRDDKLIVKFALPDTHFAPIQEETLEDENEYSDSGDPFTRMGGNISPDQEKEVNEKIAIILSIKMDEMQKKFTQLISIHEPMSLVQVIGGADTFDYSLFRKIVLGVAGNKVKLSEDDLKTIFFILDDESSGSVSVGQAVRLADTEWVLDKMRGFYSARINRDMVKNTLFKLGKVKNNCVQIYQVKNGSLLQFQSIERSILPEHEAKPRRPPHFGPLKAPLRSKPRSHTTYRSNQQLQPNQDIKLERKRIEKILKMSKEEKKRDKSGDTIASKLRSLFIHKVILPREKMLEEEKEKYLKNKIVPHDLFVKSGK